VELASLGKGIVAPLQLPLFDAIHDGRNNVGGNVGG